MTVHTAAEASTLAAARTALATALEAATGYTCHPSYTSALHTPCYVLEPDGWQHFGGGGAVLYRLRLSILYADQSGDTALGVEELARAAHVAWSDAGWAAYDIPAPGSITNPSDPNRPLAGVQVTLTRPTALE